MPKTLQPMLASPAGTLPELHGWTIEPKWDGIRLIANVSPRRVQLLSRNGIDKAPQFTEVASALTALADEHGPMVLDGEVVAVDARGKPLRFQALQTRGATAVRTAFIAFDCLAADDALYASEAWTIRRKVLERIVPRSPRALVRRGDSYPCGSAGAKRLLATAQREGWEGFILKRMDSTYVPGSRSPFWRKVKLEREQEFVIGGYTLPEGAGRSDFGALLVGYYDDDGALQYAGKVGTGYTRAVLRELGRQFARLTQDKCPFVEVPRAQQRSVWLKPKLVAQVRYNEMTEGGRLRQPVYLGLRDDKRARDVGLEAGTSHAALVRTLECKA